jgi:hypothetical protein
MDNVIASILLSKVKGEFNEVVIDGEKFSLKEKKVSFVQGSEGFSLVISKIEEVIIEEVKVEEPVIEEVKVEEPEVLVTVNKVKSGRAKN